MTPIDESQDKLYIIKPTKFWLLYTMSFGLYSLWWTYITLLELVVLRILAALFLDGSPQYPAQ